MKALDKGCLLSVQGSGSLCLFLPGSNYTYTASHWFISQLQAEKDIEDSMYFDSHCNCRLRKRTNITNVNPFKYSVLSLQWTSALERVAVQHGGPLSKFKLKSWQTRKLQQRKSAWWVWKKERLSKLKTTKYEQLNNLVSQTNPQFWINHCSRTLNAAIEAHL